MNIVTWDWILFIYFLMEGLGFINCGNLICIAYLITQFGLASINDPPLLFYMRRRPFLRPMYIENGPNSRPEIRPTKEIGYLAHPITRP